MAKSSLPKDPSIPKETVQAQVDIQMVDENITLASDDSSSDELFGTEDEPSEPEEEAQEGFDLNLDLTPTGPAISIPQKGTSDVDFSSQEKKESDKELTSPKPAPSSQVQEVEKETRIPMSTTPVETPIESAIPLSTEPPIPLLIEPKVPLSTASEILLTETEIPHVASKELSPICPTSPITNPETIPEQNLLIPSPSSVNKEGHFDLVNLTTEYPVSDLDIMLKKAKTFSDSYSRSVSEFLNP